MTFYKQKWFFGCLVVAFVCAIASYWYFDSYPELVKTSRGSPISGLAIKTLGSLIFSLPVFLLVALIWPRASTVLAAQIHAGFYLSFLLLGSLASGSPGHSSPGAQFADLIETVLYVILAFELLMIGVANSLRKRRGYIASKVTGIFVCSVIVCTLLGGWFAGVALWSLNLPPKILAAAEAEAQGKPYCIKAVNNPVKNKLGLNALNMYAGDSGGFTLFFHGLLVIQEENGRQYMNWSYRREKFDEVSEGIRKGMGLARSEHCTPIQDFGKKLPLIIPNE